MQITEIFPGQAGTDLTEDWFEITNTGTTDWVAANDPALFYDDESADPADAVQIMNLTNIPAGGSVVIVLTNDLADVNTLISIWSPVANLSGIEVGWADGSGLGGGGDAVTLWEGDPNAGGTMIDMESYPDTGANDGQSYDIALAAFSTVGNANGAVATQALGGDNMDVPNIASPGNQGAASFNLQITEIFPGQAGDDLTEDWFEITNVGSVDWVSGVDPALFYDDESADPADAVQVSNLLSIPAGASAIVVLTNDVFDINDFTAVWSPVTDLFGIEIGFADGSGLGGGGDAVTLWVGDPNAGGTLADSESYPDTGGNDGQSYDSDLGSFSEVGNANNAVQTIALGGDLMDVPNIGSPGNLGPAATYTLEISEIFPGQAGDDLTEDWFEITNTGTVDWNAASDPALFYDDESADPADAVQIMNLTSIPAGGSAIVVLTNDLADVNTFIAIWDPVSNLDGIEVGWADGSGLGGDGDAVTLWEGDPNAGGTIADMESYPDTGANDGQSYDSQLIEFSVVGNANGAVATIALGGDMMDTPNIGSPGNQGPALTYVLEITEIFPGQAGDDLTEDWFEIKNTGDVAWEAVNDPALFYDDESADPLDAVQIMNLSSIPAGGTAIVVLTNDLADVQTFIDTWNPVSNLAGIEVGWADGSGLGGGGDAVTLWEGDPNTGGTLADMESYPDTGANDGQSYDSELGEFSVVGNANGAVETIELGGDNMDVPNIGSPGNQGPALIDLQITEIFPGQAGDDLTEDWFEITNFGNLPWEQANEPALFYDDESADPLDAVQIMNLTSIPAGGKAIVVLSNDMADATAFLNIWSPVMDFTDVQVGFADGSGLGGGGDAVTLWSGDPNTGGTLIDIDAYPDTGANDGQSYDVDLGAFSVVGNANGAVATLALGGDNSDVPNIGSPGFPLTLNPLAPSIEGDPNQNYVNFSGESPFALSGVINDPTDPATFDGINLILADPDNATTDLVLTAVSDNQMVVTDANLVLSGTGDNRNLSITPTGVGFANITITVTDPDQNTASATIQYAASQSANFPATSRFHTGAADGSTAIPVDADFMWVADDEDQTLRLFDRNFSGYPFNEIDFNGDLGSTEEVDIEGSIRAGNRVFFLGSHATTPRSVVFEVSMSGTGAMADLTFVGSYTDLRQNLLDWDANNGHGLGANFLALANGFEIEGLSNDPNSTNGAFLGLRGPVNNGDGILIPVTNFKALTTNMGEVAAFGTPVFLNLAGRSLRSIDCNANGCLIIAGPVGSITGFELFTWSGNANDAPELRDNNLAQFITDPASYEGIVELPSGDFLGADGDGKTVQLIVDTGIFDYYNNGQEAKDLANDEWKKFRSELIDLGPVIPTPVANFGDVIITEIMQNPDAVGDGDGEWFELYNNTNATIDLNGWIIADQDIDAHTIDNGGPLEIAPSAYLVLGINDDVATNGGVNVAYDYGATGSYFLSNSADEIYLITPQNTVIDSVKWDDGLTFPDPTGASMQLFALNLDNNLGENWCEGQMPYGAGDLGTPNMENDCPIPPSADLVVTEIWPGQDGTDLTADWFEITNFGTVAWVSGVDPDLFYDDDSQDPTAADPINGITDIQPGESVIVVVDAQTAVQTFIDVWSPDYDISTIEVGWTDGSGLSQGGDAVTLFVGGPDATTIVDVAAYPSAPSGVSYDLVIGAFSQAGVGSPALGTNIAAATTATAGADGMEPAVGSPGNIGLIVSVEDVFAANGFMAYPNPTDGILQIEFEATTRVDQVQIFDMTGQLLQSWQPGNSNLIPVDLTEQAAGVYVIQMITTDRVLSASVVKQ
ncbi:MAG: DUF3616 domain-containing protein [Bacteroidota bacterium]